ncbi:MAPEG family protein [Microvirga sp. VF16]|uniref:MAPEG family protein n=1 Tax=Microvirga sp. VF16 TaxID=2807101 RepID=UPI00193E8472|nr:MAPEG family protein [Microvirga sp. VF16]QRM35265.1 MAPEG family protein [Microvirga sp. VF16]
MAFDKEQRGILRGTVLALLVGVVAVGSGVAWLPPELFGLGRTMAVGEQIAFALKADLPVFIWLAACVRSVATGRFNSPVDRRGAAFGPPSPALAVRTAVLQNSLEQTVLAVGAHLILATVLRGSELILIPVLVFLYLVGRLAFAFNYVKGAPSRAFGMVLTGAPTGVGYVLAASLMLAGR